MALITYIIDWIRRLCVFNSTSLPHVASYTRELPVNIARMYENAIDGEHLPWLHRDTFATLRITKSGNWGWRGDGHLQPKSFMTWMELELRLDREKHRWITTTLRGLGKGTQIVTHAIPLEENRIKVVVDFYVPKLPRLLHGLYAKQLVDTYAKLYDEDLWMMSTRQQRLYRNNEPASSEGIAAITLGTVDEINQNTPLLFELQGRQFRLINIDGELHAHATTCPHMLGPLQEAAVVDGEVTCPWHGYRFDVISGACSSGQNCKLAAAPTITIVQANVIAEIKRAE